MMDKENHDLNLDRDFVADLGVPFVCPCCNELFGSQEYLNQHTDLCFGVKQHSENESLVHHSEDLLEHHLHGKKMLPNSDISLFHRPQSTLDFDHNISSSRESSNQHSPLSKNKNSSLDYDSFPFDLPQPQRNEKSCHLSLHLSDALLSSATTEARSLPSLSASQSSVDTEPITANDSSCDDGLSSSEPVSCPGCYEIYVNQWFLNEHAKYCAKLLKSKNIQENGTASVSEQNELGKGPAPCPVCMQFHAYQLCQDQHLTSVSVNRGDPSAVSVSQAVMDDSSTSANSQDSLLHCSILQQLDESSTSNLIIITSTTEDDGVASSSVILPSAVCASNSPSERSGQEDHSGAFHVCVDCGKAFSQRSLLKAHARMHTGEKPFVCEECGQKFSYKNNLKKHYLIHTKEKPYHCTICGVSFNHNSGLKVHLRTHTGEKPFECSKCGQRFSSNGNLRKHLIIHTGEKPFSCKVCGRRFSEHSALKAHAAAHTGEKSFMCPICDVAFTHKGGLEAHFRTHTGEKPFKCHICGLTFARNGGLKAHLRTHTGEKPFACSECHQAFAHKSNLNAHLRTHTGEKPFCCTNCDQKFANKSNLKKHLKTHQDTMGLLSPAGSMSDSSCPGSERQVPTTAPSPPVISALTKMTSFVFPSLPEDCESKFFDLLDMLEHPSTQALLET